MNDERSLRNISRENLGIAETMKELNKLFSDNSPTADRSIAIVGGALIEHALREQILSRCVELAPEDRKKLFSHETNAPLCDLASRILMGYALGIYGPVTRSDLTKINEIRNGFAHSVEGITFETPGVARICDQLLLWKEQTMPPQITDMGPKRAFIQTVIIYMMKFREKEAFEGTSALSAWPKVLP